MKYLKRYNEEIHLNPLQFGKAKVKLAGGSTIYVNQNEKLSEENRKVVLADCLKLINRDLDGGWVFEKYLGDNHPPYWEDRDKILFTKGNYAIQIIIHNKVGRLDDLKEFDYQYLYKLNLTELLSSEINEAAARRKAVPELKSYKVITDYLAANHLSRNPSYTEYLVIDNNSHLYFKFKDEFKDLPTINLDMNHLKELIKNYQTKIKEIKATENKEKKNIDYIKGLYPKLIEELGDIVSDLKDFTSFSEEKYVKKGAEGNFNFPILTLTLYWERLKTDNVSFQAEDINDWDYLTKISQHIKQIDARVRYLSNEYFKETGHKLELRVDPRGSWEVAIYISSEDPASESSEIRSNPVRLDDEGNEEEYPN